MLFIFAVAVAQCLKILGFKVLSMNFVTWGILQATNQTSVLRLRKIVSAMTLILGHSKYVPAQVSIQVIILTCGLFLVSLSFTVCAWLLCY